MISWRENNSYIGYFKEKYIFHTMVDFFTLEKNELQINVDFYVIEQYLYDNTIFDNEKWNWKSQILTGKILKSIRFEF